MNKERAKSALLMILIIMCIMLVQNIWFDLPLHQVQKVSAEENQRRVKEIREGVIVPKRVVLGFWEGQKASYYTVLLHEDRQEAWAISRPILNDFFNGNTEIKSIQSEDYASVKRGSFVELEFADGMPSALISSVFGSASNNIVKRIRKIEKIVLPVYNPGIVYMHDGDGTIFEITLKIYNDNNLLSFFLNRIEDDTFIKHYNLFSFVENDVILPLNYDVSLVRIFVKNRIDIEDEYKIMKRAQSFFDENFDFVRMIREKSGAFVYLYGFAEKTVRINTQGKIEYTKDIANTFSSNVVDALDVALAFIEKHDSFPENTYLSEVKSISCGENDGYFFGFNYIVGKYSIQFTESDMNHAVEIEVFGNEIRSYESLIRNKMDAPVFVRREVILPPHSIIENNIQLFKEKHALDYGKEISTVGNEDIIKSIVSVEMVYYDTMEISERQLLIPSWEITTAKRNYFFDGYRGKLLKHTIRQGTNE